MSPSPEQRDDEGFSLIEVIVSIGVLMVVIIALLPQLVIGIQATGSARLLTQAKGVGQGQLEKMRNLPYHISPDAGDFRDVLDTYYRNLSPANTPSCLVSGTYAMPDDTWSGYVSPSANRCDYEPSGVAFYRKVVSVPATSGGAPFAVVVDTQFLSGSTPPQTVTPRSAYDSQSLSSNSLPAAAQIGVVVTVLYGDRAKVKSVSTYTQIADRPAATVRVRAEASATAVDVGSETTANGPVTLSAGVLNMAGSLTYASTANANLAGVAAGLATGEQRTGATASRSAPPASSAAVVTDAQDSLTTAGCEIACWGSSRVNMGELSVVDGLPVAGSPTSPMQALVTDRGSHEGVSFGNSTAADYRPGLDLAPPLLRLHTFATAAASGISSGCASGGSGALSFITAGGYLKTTAATDTVDPSMVDSCVVARTASISLFPTSFAPQGVVVVELQSASARCTVAGTAHDPTAAYAYSAVVKYWNGTAYQSLATISPSLTTDPLEALDLDSTPVGGGHMLGDYISSWSSLQAAEITASAADGVAEVALPGVVTIASQPTRSDGTAADGLDATSVVSVTVGALSCLSEDIR